MKYIIHIILVALCFGCNQSKKEVLIPEIEVTSEHGEFIDHFEKEFLASVNFLELDKPYLITAKLFDTFNLLSKEESEVLEVRDVFKANDTISKFGMALNLGFSKDFKSFVLYQFDEDKLMNYKLVNYTNDYQFIDAIAVSYYDLTSPINQTQTYVYNDKLFVLDKKTNKTKAYVLKGNGVFEAQTVPVKFNYLPLKQYQSLIDYTASLDQRVVKAKNGVKDSIGRKIGMFSYLQTVSVLDYADNKAKVIVHPETLKKDDNFYIDTSNIGYVLKKDLFDVYQDEVVIYKYEGLKVNGNAMPLIDLRELLQVKQIKLNKYLNSVIKKPHIVNVTDSYKMGKRVTLIAENGKQVTFKDSTFATEYNPTKTYSVSEDSNFDNTFVVHSQMIFDYKRLVFVSKINGEQLDTYAGGYPHVSPNKKYVISVDYDVECPSQRTVFIDKITNNKIIKGVEIYYNLEDNNEYIDLEKTTDTNEIYWLSNTEFIIKFWGATECYSDSENYFYYKYKIKQPLLDLLEVK